MVVPVNFTVPVDVTGALIAIAPPYTVTGPAIFAEEPTVIPLVFPDLPIVSPDKSAE